jgi:Leucine-rich repeat (LRR) protein
MPKLTYTTPPPSLMIELREVAADAGALATEITSANQLSADFPAEQLQELLVQLQSLPNGTAEGCRQPLEYTRSRLPAIRRKFIQTELRSHSLCRSVDLPPPLTRGMIIDQRLGTLVNSVTTALDEYRALASVELEDGTDTSPSFKIDTTAPDVVGAIAASVVAEKNLGLGDKRVEEITEVTSTNADSLRRQMRDARGLLVLARVELRMPEFVPRWYRNTINTIKDYPKLLQKTARAMQVGVDVTRPLADAWSNFTHGYKRLILDSVEQAATGLETVGRKWEAEAEQAAIREASAPPPDFDLTRAVEMICAGETPKASWRPWIHELDFSEQILNDLSPLLGLTGLRSLNLGGSDSNNYWPLAGLGALENLNLSRSRIKNVAPLAGLINLKTLDLDDTQVSDLAPLSYLTALETLWLNHTQVSDLGPLSNLAALKELYLDGTPLNEITPIGNLTGLRELWLDGTAVNNLEPIKNLTNLVELWLGNTSVTDLRPLATLHSLTTLFIDRTEVTDLSPLARLSSLVMLTLEHTPVKNLAPLAGLSELRRVLVETEKRRKALAKTLPTRPGVVIARESPSPLSR